MKKTLIFTVCLINIAVLQAQSLERLWTEPSDDARPWTFWYWMQGAVSKEGITADLEAMKNAGLAGAYLMPIKGVPEKPFVTPSVEQLSPLWWEMLRYTFGEADRLNMKLGFHVCDGFALAGGPWITPELSMQRVVWNKARVKGGGAVTMQLPQPPSNEDYYRDIAVFAYPAPDGEGINSEILKPEVTNSLNINAQYLTDTHNEEVFRSEDPCYIQYKFDKPFTCRSVQIREPSRNLQGQRLKIEVSDDGKIFRHAAQLEPPRQGWQNDDMPATHSIPPVTARFFRFLWDKEGTEPGSEDLDAAKWKQTLKIKSIFLSSEASIHQYEAKNGSVWRVAPRSTANQLPDALCIDTTKLVNISGYVDDDGVLNYNFPQGDWTVLRIGHTSTGQINATGGKGAGLECDKFNPEAVKLQFDSWFGKTIDEVGAELASRVLKIFHVDSWECGSQNWSPVFREEFLKRRGYDIVNFLPVMAGVPVASAEISENLLYDVRQTVAELINDNFFAVFKSESAAKNCVFSAECVAPTMLSDGMSHFRYADIPMGEFWFNSPTHDKMNDVLDAVSGGHIYEKNIIQAEAFTELRMTFDEHPAMVKTLQDRHYALGINRLSFHVWTLNPWLDRKPGMSLDGIGFFFQRDQTWWKMVRAWTDYTTRCQALLQYGKPVVDIAVFTGEELPRRAILPYRLTPFLPGLFGEEKTEKEKIRMANTGLPVGQKPVGVTYSANITDASEWINPLRGYAYDSFNADALINLATVENGRIVLPGGMSYAALVVPGTRPMQPSPFRISPQVSDKINSIKSQGVTVIDSPYNQETLSGIERDFLVTEKSSSDDYAPNVAYTHRHGDNIDIWFISNQEDRKRFLEVSLRASGRLPELWDPVTGEITSDLKWQMADNRTIIDLALEPEESVFIVMQTPVTKTEGTCALPKKMIDFNIVTPWKVKFCDNPDVVVFNELTDWSENEDPKIRWFSGEAVYSNKFSVKKLSGTRYYLDIENVYNMAEIKINGKVCGIIWAKPYRIEITQAIKNGANTVEITVANTWANRIMGEENFGYETDRPIWTNARYRLSEKKPVKSGLVGKIAVYGVK